MLLPLRLQNGIRWVCEVSIVVHSICEPSLHEHCIFTYFSEGRHLKKKVFSPEVCRVLKRNQTFCRICPRLSERIRRLLLYNTFFFREAFKQQNNLPHIAGYCCQLRSLQIQLFLLWKRNRCDLSPLVSKHGTISNGTAFQSLSGLWGIG